MAHFEALRDYQQAAVLHTRNAVGGGMRRVYFTLPTGTGKTHVLSHLASGFERVVVLAHRIELIDQLARRLSEDWNRSVGIVRARRDEWYADFVIATPQTLHGTRLNAILRCRPDALFIDEAHHTTPGSRYDLIIQSLEAARPDLAVIGCTATPFRADKRRMQEVLPTCTFSRTIDEMQQQGWLCPLQWKQLRVDMQLGDVHSATTPEGRDYKIDELAAQAERPDVIEATVAQTVPLLGDRPTAAFAVDVSHAQALAEAYRAVGTTAAAVWGQMPKDERVQVIKAWKAHEIQVVTNCAVLTEGFDFPEIAALVMARPTQSPGLYAQMVGRGTRVADGKPDCLVLDLCGNDPVDDARQVLLPEIAAVSHEDELPDVFTHADATGSRQLHFRNPGADRVYRWIRDDGSYYLPAADGITLVVQVDPNGSGLYQLAATKRDQEKRLSPQPDTIWEQQRLAHLWLDRYAVPALSGHDQDWHERPATEKQIEFLRSLHSAVAQQAIDEGWNRVRVRDEITRCLVRRKQAKLRTLLWPGIGGIQRCS